MRPCCKAAVSGMISNMRGQCGRPAVLCVSHLIRFSACFPHNGAIRTEFGFKMVFMTCCSITSSCYAALCAHQARNKLPGSNRQPSALQFVPLSTYCDIPAWRHQQRVSDKRAPKDASLIYNRATAKLDTGKKIPIVAAGGSDM